MVDSLHSARVDWSERLAEALAGRYLPDYPMDSVITVGWPSKGSRPGRSGRQTTGECAMAVFDPNKDGTEPRHFISLHPSLFRDALEVAHTLLHEMIHATLATIEKETRPERTELWRVKHPGHKGAFVKLCKAVGLVKPWTATRPGPELRQELMGIIKGLGLFPFGGADLHATKKKQGIRQVLGECHCGRKIRASKATWKQGPVVCGLCKMEFLVDRK